jgi:hypothetical protein
MSSVSVRFLILTTTKDGGGLRFAVYSEACIRWNNVLKISKIFTRLLLFIR